MGGRAWSESERTAIRVGVFAGKTAEQIAKQLKARTPMSVYKQAALMGLSLGHAGGGTNPLGKKGGYAPGREDAEDEGHEGGPGPLGGWKGKPPATPVEIRRWMSLVICGRVKATPTQITSARALLAEIRVHGAEAERRKRGDGVPASLRRWLEDPVKREILMDFIHGKDVSGE